MDDVSVSAMSVTAVVELARSCLRVRDDIAERMMAGVASEDDLDAMRELHGEFWSAVRRMG